MKVKPKNKIVNSIKVKTKQNMKESQRGPQMEVGLPIVPRTNF